MKLQSTDNGRGLRAWAGIAALGALAMASPVSAQLQRAVLPEGTVLSVTTESEINSQTAQVGQVLVTRLTEPVSVEGRTVIPAGSRIEATISMARAATSRESGVVGVDFTRLVLPNGRALAIQGKLTSFDPAERRQIDSQGDGRVVFVGGRRGFGSTIGAIGAGVSNDLSGVLGALGTALSRGGDVIVPANTALAVQLESGVTLTATGTARPDAGTIYTSTDMIRSAQQSLRAKNYYRGAVDGRLTNETRRALFEFQLDNQLFASGNLDGQTAEELGLTGTATAMGLTANETALVRRNAQALAGSWRDLIGVTSAGRLTATRTYYPAELELWFALSAFADNSSLYDQMTRTSIGNVEGMRAAGLALIASARRVDGALQGISAPARTVSAWQAIQSDLSAIDPTYPR